MCVLKFSFVGYWMSRSVFAVAKYWCKSNKCVSHPSVFYILFSRLLNNYITLKYYFYILLEYSIILKYILRELQKYFFDLNYIFRIYHNYYFRYKYISSIFLKNDF